ncbi:MAG: PEP-CTERM sorting domain-containing protein [Rubrivivax sp.]
MTLHLLRRCARLVIAGSSAAALLLPATAGATLVDVTGTNSNDFLTFVSTTATVSTTLQHPADGRPIAVNGSYRVNGGRYDGRNGTDTLSTTNDADWLRHTAAEPTLIATERIFAGDGNDVIEIAAPVTGTSGVQIDGGGGSDIVLLSAAMSATVNLRQGDDLIGWSGTAGVYVDGMEGNDRFWSGLGSNDYLVGGDGDDVLSLLVAGWGDDVFVGGDGFDLIDFGNLALADFSFGWLGDARWSSLAWHPSLDFDPSCASGCLLAWHQPSGSALAIHLAGTEALQVDGRVVDLQDQAQLAALLAGPAAQQVPESGTLPLLALGLGVGLGARRRSRGAALAVKRPA